VVMNSHDLLGKANLRPRIEVESEATRRVRMSGQNLTFRRQPARRRSQPRATGSTHLSVGVVGVVEGNTPFGRGFGPPEGPNTWMENDERFEPLRIGVNGGERTSRTARALELARIKRRSRSPLRLEALPKQVPAVAEVGN
jgi:hypothetical protein